MMKLIYTAFLTLAVTSALYSQIDIRKEHTNVTLKPQAYDSLMTGIEYYDTENIYQYKKYIGQSLFFKPYTQDYIKSFVTNKESTITVIPVPFEKTDIGRILSNSLGNATKKQKGDLPNTYKEWEAKYLSKFTIKTNIYYPIIINEKDWASGISSGPIICNNTDALSGKSFLVIDIFSGHDLNNKVNINPQTKVTSELLLFRLLDENKDTLYWKTASRELMRDTHFIVQGYYDKQKSYYVGRQFVYRDQIPSEYVHIGDKGLDNNYERIIKSNTSSFQKGDIKDINTKETISIIDQDVWECVDFALINSNYNYKLYYVMRNYSCEIKIPAGEMAKYGFVFKESYDKEQELRKLKQEEFEAWQKQEKAKRVAADANHKKHLLSKYGNEIGMKLYNGQVSLGMTKEMCIEAWGHTNSIVTNSLVEIWVYSYGNSLTFNGNKLVQIVSL